jgi:hypothetical protein
MRNENLVCTHMHMKKIRKTKICTSSEKPKDRLFMSGYQQGKIRDKIKCFSKMSYSYSE